MECTKHKKGECFECLKEAVENVLYMTRAAGNGGYISQFGVITFDALVTLTGYDLENRTIK